MAIILNKNKDLNKTVEIENPTRKAQDETVQITRKEWDAMQESLAQLQTFMNDLVEGNLEIEIVDDGKEDKEEVEEIEAKPEEKGDEEIEEIEVEPEGKDEPKPEEEEEKGEDAELEEVMKDPAKRKAVLEYLKATDSVHPIKDLNLSKIRKRVNTIVSREKFDVAYKGKTKLTPNDVVNEIMSTIKADKKSGKPITVDSLGKVANKFLNSLNTKTEPAKAGDGKQTIKRKTIKKSIDSAIPDFTSRFETTPRVQKAVDTNKKKDLSKAFADRFN